MLKIAHRGASGYEPENTLRSFKRAIELKADMIELDTYLTKDNQVVIIHDETVNRTTNGKGKVKNLTLKELKQLDAGKGEKIPTLEEVFDLVNKKVQINIELKGKGTAKPVSNLIEKYVKKGWTNKHFLVSSFDFNELKVFYSVNKKVRLGVLFERSPDLYLKRTKQVNAYSINPGLKHATKKFVDKAHQKDLKVYVWTVNSKKKIQRLKLLAVDGVFTNFLDHFQQ
jgi:glycerophosphoryl diester phosphodiesterase